MTDLLARIGSGEVLVGDGAMGTMLIARGLAPGAPPEAVNLEDPVTLEDIARLYLEAGAQILETNTFGGSPHKLALYGLADRTEEINRAAVAAVRRVADGRAYVAGSCGPSGRMLKPYGDTDPAELRDGFVRQMRALVAAGIDLVMIETMTDLNEAVLAVQAARSVSAELPILASMTFDATPRGFYTIMGVTVAQAASGLAGAGAQVIGSNCGNGIAGMVAVAQALREETNLPLLIQANAGLPLMDAGRTVYPEEPEFMAARVGDLIQAGVKVIGGCCGTTPAHIRAFRAAVDRACGRREA
ncbi:MAG: homocysteine S-methyltransferase family protein [Candidatus Eisenbacteria bacterium]